MDRGAGALGSILDEFPGVDYCFLYGSGVFEQTGYSELEKRRALVDVIMSVRDVEQWHSANITLNAHHYSAIRYCSYSWIAKNIGAGVFFMPNVELKTGLKIKYGVISTQRALTDLETWQDLYFSGRLHKPVRVIQPNALFDKPIQQNLRNAVVTGLLLAPPRVSLEELLLTIAGISYMGDIRMRFAENPNKVKNIVYPHYEQFMNLYVPALLSVPGVEYNPLTELIERNPSWETTLELYNALPLSLRNRTRAPHGREQLAPTLLQKPLSNAIRCIGRRSSLMQTSKGLLTAGLLRSLSYGARKVLKFLGR